ncbi:MAG: low specificity L-threonine aldolase [Verrucomicrobiia bacterium Tous-C4TDCM]|jgi:threonine aldolase|nr:MAG: low specificity L-threonine aldolase [Verrucomicrobiae bacterium Tous-C4TDCM]
MMPIDLRSDTITRPTPAMREAMAAAEVGDDMFGEDPTVAKLEARVAELLGKEAAMFAPSGTMVNQLALRAHTEPGDEVILDGNAHIYYYEGGAPAALAGVMCRCLPGVRGIFTAADLEAVLRPTDQHFPPTKLVCLENTHNRGGGKIWPQELVREIGTLTRERGIRLHLDGARLWNAAVARGVSERELAAEFDSVAVCFSKGLGAPVGSALCGSGEFIQRARRFRKMFGGGMRQAGIIAAGALHALEHHRERLAEDHANARALADGLSALPGIELDPAAVETNIVIARVTTVPADRLARELDEAGLRVFTTGPDTIRAVTSLAVPAGEIQRALGVFERTLSKLSS